MRDDLLFWEYDWFRVVEGQKGAMQKEVERMSRQTFGANTVEELCERLCAQFSLKPPTIDRGEVTVSQREANIEIGRGRDTFLTGYGAQTVKGTAVDVVVPFVGNGEMFKVKPTTWTTKVPRGRVSNGAVRYTISGTRLLKEEVKAEIEDWLKDLEEWLGYQEESVGNFPVELSRLARQSLEARKAKLDADDDLISGLGFKTA